MKGLLIFTAGLALGAIAGAYAIKNKVQAEAKEEIEEVREYYRTKGGEETTKEEIVSEETTATTDVEHVNYNKITSNYITQSNSVCQTPDYHEEPYIIDPEDFGSRDDYDTMTLTYFADGVLVDDVDDVVDEQDIVVGLDNLKVFSELGASSVYVRNDIYRTDYEILRDDWNWSDLNETPKKPIKEKKPHQL